MKKKRNISKITKTKKMNFLALSAIENCELFYPQHTRVRKASFASFLDGCKNLEVYFFSGTLSYVRRIYHLISSGGQTVKLNRESVINISYFIRVFIYIKSANRLKIKVKQRSDLQ